MIFVIFTKNVPRYFWANQKFIIMRILSILSILMLPVMGQAHPGHGASNGHDAIHYLASGHAGPAILLLTALCIYFILREPKTQSQRTKH